MKCFVCGGETGTLHAEVAEPNTLEKFSILACRECGFGQTFPQPESLDFYYAEYHGKRHGFTADYCARRRGRWVEQSVSGQGRVLDIGCGAGTFLDEMKKRGWRAAGTELNARKFADSDLEVFEDLGEVKAKYGLEKFDAVTMWHTLEHFPNPRQILLDAFGLLAPGGALLVAVPDAGGFQARFFGKNWMHGDVPRHLFHFTSESLETLLKECGFEVKNRRHQEFEYDLLGWSQSALNSIFTEPNVFFKILTGKTASASLPVKAANFALGALFSACAAPLVPLGTLCKKGGTIIVGARKK